MAWAAEGDGLQSRRAEAVDGHGAGRVGDAGQERRLPRHVHALLGLGHGAAEDDVVDELGPQRGHPRSRAALMAAAAMSSGRVSRKVPLPALPTAVRTDETTTASRIVYLVPTNETEATEITEDTEKRTRKLNGDFNVTGRIS